MESPVQPQPPPSEIPSSTNPRLRIRFILSTPPPPPPTAATAGNQRSILSMEDRFREAIMKIANNNANKIQLTGRHKTLIEQTLADFLDDFHTPEHPPYAAMILRAIEELKEKRGSSEESISKYIKNEYKDLPWAHYTLLKHHLGKLCDDGEVIITNKQLYLLAGANFSLSNSGGPKEKLKRKRSSATGRIKSKRFRKRNREKEEGMGVIEGKHRLTVKCHEEFESLNEIVEREAEVIEEDSQPLKVPNEVIEENVEDDQLHRKMPDYEVNGQQREMIEGQILVEIQPIALTPERHPCVGLTLADGYSQTKEQQSKDFGLLKEKVAFDLPLNSTTQDKEGHGNLLEFRHPGESLETEIPPETSLSNSLNPESFEQEHHHAFPDENGPAPAEVAPFEELSFTMQQIKEQQRRKGRSNSEFKKIVSNPEGSEKKCDRAKRIQPHRKGMMGPDLTLNSSKIEKQSLSELSNQSTSQEQQQQGLSSPLDSEIMTDSISSPMDQKHLDHERQPCISNLEGPVESGQAVEKESSQSERMQRQMKCWDRTPLKHSDRRRKSSFRVKKNENHDVTIYSEKTGQEKQVQFSAEKEQVGISQGQEEYISKSGGLGSVSTEQDELLCQLELPTPAKRQESKQAPQGSNQIGGQRPKLRSWKRQNTLEQNANQVAHSSCSPLALQLPHKPTDTLEKSSTTLVQRSKLRSWKLQNQSEENTDSLNSTLASLLPKLPCRQKLKTGKPVRTRLGRLKKVRRRKSKLLKNLGKPDVED